MSGAILRGAILRDAELIDADLAYAVLLGVDLSGTDLDGSRNLKQEQLNEACADLRGGPKNVPTGVKWNERACRGP